MLKHGFLIIAHTHLVQLGQIIEVLSSPNHYFFINIDLKNVNGIKYMQKYANQRNVYFITGKERMEVSHGGYSMVECTLKLLHKAQEKGMDYYHLMSGQDFPCRSNNEFDDFFAKNEGYSYMLMDSDKFRRESMVRKYPSRIKPWYFYDIKHRDVSLVNFVARGLNFVSRRFEWRKDIPNLWGAWQWFSWHKTVTDYVLKEELNNQSFFRRFQHTSCSDELIFATLLHDHRDQLKIISNNSLRYINWKKFVEGRKKKNSPLILNEDEYDDIVESGVFFCRKVDPIISRKLLSLLEERINALN